MIRPSLPRGKGERATAMRISRERAPAAHALAAAPAAGEGGKTLAAFLSEPLLLLPAAPFSQLRLTLAQYSCERLRDDRQEDHATCI